MITQERYRRLARPVDLVAVNHRPKAVATHQFNHPWARHYCAEMEALHPRKAVTTKDRHALVTPSYGFDILLRKAEVCRQIGNAVPGETAKSVFRVILGGES